MNNETSICKQDFYFSYSDFQNPDCVKKILKNYRKICKLNYCKTTWLGIFKVKRINRLITKIESQNKRILLKYNPKMSTYRIGSWIDGRRQHIFVLEVFKES